MESIRLLYFRGRKVRDTIKAIKRPINLRYDTQDVRFSSATLALITVVKRTCSVTRGQDLGADDTYNTITLPLVRNKVTSTRPEPRTHFDTVNGVRKRSGDRVRYSLCVHHTRYILHERLPYIAHAHRMGHDRPYFSKSLARNHTVS